MPEHGRVDVDVVREALLVETRAIDEFTATQTEKPALVEMGKVGIAALGLAITKIEALPAAAPSEIERLATALVRTANMTEFGPQLVKECWDALVAVIPGGLSNPDCRHSLMAVGTDGIARCSNAKCAYFETVGPG